MSRATTHAPSVFWSILSPLRTRRGLLVITACVRYVLLVLGAIITALPFVWLASSALKHPAQLWVYPPQWLPDPVRWANFPEALTSLPFARYMSNTLFISVLSLLGTVLSCSVAAYSFGRLRFPGREFLFMMILATLMLPDIVLLIPQFVLFRNLGWIDTFKPLIIPSFFAGGSGFFGGGPFTIFLLRQFFRTIPRELLDAARIDGCSEPRIFASIVMPLSKPALATVAIFTFMSEWNDFLKPLIYLHTPDKYTLAIGLAQFRDQYSAQWHYLMAASTTMSVPIVVLFFLAQKYFVRGIVMSGIKG